MADKTKQLGYWKGTFGDKYIQRNSDLDFFAKRKTFFASILKNCSDIKSILEVGCNIGGNLHILKEINATLSLTGIEPNERAVKHAKKLNPQVSIITKSTFDMDFIEDFDLVFTSGVLIHIAHTDLTETLKKIYKASKKYILTIEYYSNKRTVIPYRGLSDALFKRPYDIEWEKLYPSLTLLENGFLDKNSGFDQSNWWLYKKDA